MQYNDWKLEIKIFIFAIDYSQRLIEMIFDYVFIFNDIFWFMAIVKSRYS